MCHLVQLGHRQEVRRPRLHRSARQPSRALKELVCDIIVLLKRDIDIYCTVGSKYLTTATPTPVTPDRRRRPLSVGSKKGTKIPRKIGRKKYRLSSMSSKDPEVLWSDIASRILINVVSHPMEYAKVLIQIGHEPIPPKPTVTLFGRPALKLPNIFAYVKYIKRVDGLTGCYRGLVPKLCSYTVSTIASQKTAEYLQLDVVQIEEEDEEDESVRRKKCILELTRDTISRIVAIVVSHPLEVISLRMMAQFVGGEVKYNGIFSSFVEIYRENGFLGYYAGLVPRLIANVSVLILASASTYILNNHVVHEQAMKAYTASTMKFLATTVTYPFLVVSHCMAVNNCGLVAGMPPQMPIYRNWLDCWTHLSANNQLKRGSSLLWRYYTGPQVLINGKLVPIMTDAFYKSVQ